MIKNLNELRQDFKEVLELNNIRGYALSLEFSNLSRTIKTSAQFTQSDMNTSVISIQLLNQGAPIILERSTILYVNVKRADGTTCRNECTVLDGNTGAIVISFNQKSTEIVGTTSFEIVVISAGAKKILSPQVAYKVFESIDAFSEVPTPEDVKIVDIMVNEVVAIKEAVIVTNETIAREMIERNAIEANREKAESLRNSNESTRDANEDIRVESELSRIEKEEARLKDETTRSQNEEERKLSETNRENNETNRINKEKERLDQETKRTESESTRVANENIRVNKESERAAKETTRNKSEKARIESEKTRLDNETIRHNSESTRTTNEVTRNSNESKRITDENVRTAKEVERVEAEIVREDSEAFRVAAEVEREKKIVEFGSQLEEIKTEVDEANTDFNKVPHNNLQERLTTDFADINDRLNKAEIMEFDGSDISAKTFAGYTKEMEIKGKTWQNLLGKKGKNDTGVNTVNTVTVNENIVTIKRDPADTPNTHVGFYVNTDKNMIKKNTDYTIATLIIKNTMPINTILIDSPYTGFDLNATIQSKQEGMFKQLIRTTEGLKVDSIWCWNQKTCPNIGEIIFTIPIILEGDYTNKPIPEEYFEGIQSLGEAEMVGSKYKVEVESCGKNLLYMPNGYEELFKTNHNPGNLVQTYYPNGFELNETVSRICMSRTMGKVLGANKLFKVSVTIRNYFNGGDNSRILTHGVDIYGNQHYFQGNFYGDGRTCYLIDTKKINIAISKIGYYFQKNGDGSKADILDIMIEEVQTYDSKPTPYEPHKKDNIYYLFDEPLRGLPNGVQDTIDKDGFLSRRVGKVVLDGSESQALIIESVGSGADTILFILYDTSGKNLSSLISNNFITWVRSIYNEDIEGVYYSNYVNNPGFRIKINKNKLSSQDVTGFKKWLQNNPVTVYYELAEPITTNLKKKPTLKVYEGVTYIKSTNSIKADLAVKLPCNVNLMLSDSLKENKLLKDNIQALEIENRNINEKQDSNLNLLSDMDTNLVSTSWNMDFRLMEVEFFIEDNSPQTMLKNNKPNRGGNVMALSRFEQAKIMILGGVYVRETLEHQLNTYLKRGYMTKEEVDELIAMMDARELVEGK